MSKVYSRSELIQYVDVLKVTVPRMHKLSIPVTPENYAVWYTYSQGSNLDLNTRIDNYLNDGISFTEEINSALYSEFIEQHPSDELKNTQDATQNFISQLIDKMEGMSAGSSKFSEALKGCKQLLGGKPDINQLTTMVSHILQETEIISRSNNEMINSLELMRKEVEQLKSGVESLTETAHTDQLTNIANRRAFDQHIKILFSDVNNNKFSLLLMDIDHFKIFNDTYGHAVGDKVLIYVAKLLKRGVTKKDLAARYGGEEFVVLLPNTDNKKALKIADSLRLNIAEQKLTSTDTKKKMGHITISVGVATATIRDDPKSLVERADKAMYLAKKQGRNRVSNEYDF